MAEQTTPFPVVTKSRDEIALELTKFIAETTGYGKGGATPGFAGKQTKSPEEYAEALVQLYERCRAILSK